MFRFTKTILLADDYEADASAARMALAAAGIVNPVFIVLDGDEAIAYLAGEGKFADRTQYPFPSVLLVDLKMRRVDGFQVLDWLHKNPPKQKLLPIVLSAYDEVSQVNLAYAMGARSFLVKPVHPQDIRNLAKSYPEYWDLGLGTLDGLSRSPETFAE